MKLKLLSIALTAVVSMGYINAKVDSIKEDYIPIKAICNEKNAQGECIKWSVFNRGCIGPCKQAVKYKHRTAVCNAVPDGLCNAQVNTEAEGKTTKTTVDVLAPCWVQNSKGKCLRWGVMLQGCKAPANGTCTATVAYKHKRQTCTAKNGETCEAKIHVQTLRG